MGVIGWGIFWAPNIIFTLGVSVLCAVGLYEFLTNLKLKGVQINRLFGVSMGAILPLVQHFQFGLTQSGEVLFIVLSCFCLFVIQFMRRENPRALEGIALTFFGIMYIAWFLSYAVKIKYLPQGAFWLSYVLVVTKVSDISAYAVGTVWGKRPLIAHISPRKSVEGTLAGVAGSALISVAFLKVLPVEFHPLQLLALGAVIGLVGQCGDLAESLFKRYCDVKDSGRWVPGFGGTLDLLDSVLFTTPLFYFYIKTL